MKKKVLLISDNKKNSKLINVLKELEYDLMFASEISDAIIKAKEGLHILLLDVESSSVKEEDILELIRIAKKNKIKIISVSKPFSERLDRFIKIGGSIIKETTKEKLAKDIKRNIENEKHETKIDVGKSTVSLLLIPDENDLTETGFSIISDNLSKDIIYISLEKSRDYIIEQFSKKSISDKKIFIVDCISAFYRPIEHTKNCYYALAPYELRDITIAIKNNIKKDSVIIFDSLTNLISYGREAPAGVDRIKRFVDSIRDGLKKTNSRIIFLCKESDQYSGLVSESMKVYDKIQKVEYL